MNPSTKHPAIVLQYQTANVLVMKCAQHGTHLVVATLAALTSPCHFEVAEAQALLEALEKGPLMPGLEPANGERDRRFRFFQTKGGDWGLQVFDDEPDVTWFSFAAPMPAPSGDPVALNAEGRRKLRAAVLETLFGKEARA